MTDKPEEPTQEEANKAWKGGRGFANKKQANNIRTKGRAKGSKNKKVGLTHKEFSDLILSRTNESVTHLMKLMKDGSESTQRAMVAKMMDYSLTLSIHNDKMSISKTNEKGEKKTYSIEDQGTGTSGQVLKLNFEDDE